jgi:spore coat protein U-like protein
MVTVCRFLAAMILAGVAVPATAASDTMTITATVLPSCRVDAGDMTFGSLDARQATASAKALLELECTPGTAFSVTLDEGRQGGRRMVDPTRGAFLHYDIFRDAAASRRWGSGSAEAVSGVAPEGGRVALSAYGLVTIEKAAAGAYSDVITVSVTF